MEPLRSARVRRAIVVLVALAVSLGAATASVAALEDGLGVRNASAVYLLAVVSVAVAFGIPAAVLAAFGSFLVYDLLFVQPTGLLVVADPEEWLNLLLLLLLGVVVGQLAGMQRARAETALLRERQARAQYLVGRELATRPTAAAALPEIVRTLRAETAAARVWITLGSEAVPERVVADSEPGGRLPGGASHAVLGHGDAGGAGEWIRVHEPRGAPRGELDPQLERYRVPVTVVGAAARGSLWVARPRAAGPPGRGDARVLAAAADQIGQALERDRLAEAATSAEVARHSEAAKTALLDSVSHDLRTPLASIRAAAGSLMDPALDHDPAARRERAAVIDREAERLNRLVSNLLDMSRIEAGGLRARREPFELEDLVASTLERMAGLLAEHPVTVAMRADLPPVEVDPVFMDQILTNLLENAARHTRPGAPVRVHAQEGAATSVRLTIEDGGPGVPPERLGGLFEKFSRVPRAGGGSRAGSGIGLAVVRGLVEAMGGRVEARASRLGGLAIDVDLPTATPPAGGDGDAPAQGESPR